MLLRIFFVGILFISMSASAVEPTAPANPESAPELTTAVPKEFVERKTTEPGVVLKSPKEWNSLKLDAGDAKINLAIDDQGTSVNLVIVPASKGLTLQRVLAEFPSDLKKGVPGFKMLKADFVKLTGQPVARFMYEAHLPGGEFMRVCQVILVKHEKQYILTYAALDKNFDPHLSAAEQTAASLKVP